MPPTSQHEGTEQVPLLHKHLVMANTGHWIVGSAIPFET
jgi:hypothetical protein